MMNAGTVMMPTRQRIALVLGATGGIGGAMAAKLAARGYRVRAMHRNAAAIAERKPDYEWVAGDAMRRDDVVAAAEGAVLIVHAVNPAGYRDWDKLVLPMLDNTIAAAEAAGARILLPGTVYNFGPDAFPVLREESPQNPVTRKGRIRVEMERRLEQAAERGVPVLIVRAGDFFGPGAGNNWFAQVVKPGRPVSSITLPGRAGVGHQWAYLPDLAETMMRLLEQSETLPGFARFHFEGTWDGDGRQMAEAIRRVTGKPDLPIRRFPWPLVWLAAPFVTLFGELLEMRYLWREPVRMPNDRLVAFLGEEPRTPLQDAVRETLDAWGCLGEEGTAAAVGNHVGTGRREAEA